MSADWLAAIASIATLVVIGATAVAALVQVRHMRSSNQIVALNEIRETIESEFFRETSAHVMKTLPALLKDPAIRGEIVAGTPITAIQELIPVRTLANLFEVMGTFVKRGMVDRDLACDIWATIVLTNWDAVAPLISNLRVAYDNGAIWENFEYLAVLSRNFYDKYPNGTYPKGMAREKMPEIWPELKSQAQKKRAS